MYLLYNMGGTSLGLLSLAPKSGAIYQQIVQQIWRLVALGALGPGDQLPTAKQLAIDLTINPNTVTRAYRELERDGLIKAVPGKGTFVKDDAARSNARASLMTSTVGALTTIIREAISIGISRRELRDTFDRAVEASYVDDPKSSPKRSSA
jgi:GntR family transcriptional regulator